MSLYKSARKFSVEILWLKVQFATLGHSDAANISPPVIAVKFHASASGPLTPSANWNARRLMNNFLFPLQSVARLRFAAPLGRKSGFFVVQKDPMGRRCECEFLPPGESRRGRRAGLQSHGRLEGSRRTTENNLLDCHWTKGQDSLCPTGQTGEKLNTIPVNSFTTVQFFYL